MLLPSIFYNPSLNYFSAFHQIITFRNKFSVVCINYILNFRLRDTNFCPVKRDDFVELLASLKHPTSSLVLKLFSPVFGTLLDLLFLVLFLNVWRNFRWEFPSHRIKFELLQLSVDEFKDVLLGYVTSDLSPSSYLFFFCL